IPHSGVRRRPRRAAGVRRRPAGLLPDVRALAAGRRAFFAAEGRPDGAGAERRLLPVGACGNTARAEVRPRRSGRRGAADGRRDRGRPGRGQPRRHWWQPLAGTGLALLVIPLANVVLAAVPAETAGGASGLFSTAQQLGGAVGAALLGTVFFGWVASGHTFAAATTHTGPYAVGAFMLCALL